MANNPFSMAMISISYLISHNVSLYILEHSRYQTKYRFWMFMGSFLNYSYQQTYPYCNVYLTNFVFLNFTLYQFLHNMFKFSYHLEMICSNIQRGTLTVVLPNYIQHDLQQRVTARTIGRQIQIQREEEEQDAQQDARDRLVESRQRRLVELEQNLRESMNPDHSQEQIETEVQNQMGQVRRVLESSEYQEILEQFSTLIHKPSQVIRDIQRQSNNQGEQNLFDGYTEEVNR